MEQQQKKLAISDIEGIKDSGNSFFTQKLIDQALTKYTEARDKLVKKISRNTPDQTEVSIIWGEDVIISDFPKAKRLLSIILNNISACFLSKSELTGALQYCEDSVAADNTFAKARIREIEILKDLGFAFPCLRRIQQFTNLKEASDFKQTIDDFKSQVLKQIEYEKNLAATQDFFKNKRPDKYFIGPIELKRLQEGFDGMVAVEEIKKEQTILIDKGIIYSTDLTDSIFSFLKELNDNPELKFSFQKLFPDEESQLQSGRKLYPEFDNYLKDQMSKFKEKHPKPLAKLSEEEASLYFFKGLINLRRLPDERLGIFPNSSNFKHSCKPNAIIHYYQDHQMTKAIRDIQQGEEVTISYVPLTLNKAQREGLLKRVYGFECQCSSCKGSTEWLKKIIQLEDFTCPTCKASTNEAYQECCVEYSFGVIYSSAEKELKKLTPNLEIVKDYCSILPIIIENLPNVVLVLRYLKLISEIKRKNSSAVDDLYKHFEGVGLNAEVVKNLVADKYFMVVGKS